jgi:hypothetical protein
MGNVLQKYFSGSDDVFLAACTSYSWERDVRKSNRAKRQDSERQDSDLQLFMNKERWIFNFRLRTHVHPYVRFFRYSIS